MVSTLYKDPDLRRAAKKVTSLPVCTRCSQPHWSANATGACLACQYFDLIQVEKKDLREIIDFVRTKGLCIYCGEYGDEIEHVVPRCTGLPTYTVLACRECNLIASGRLFPSFAAKQAHISKGLAKKYAKILTMPEWTEEDLGELAPRLRDHVRGFSLAAQSVRRRIEWSYWHVTLTAQ